MIDSFICLVDFMALDTKPIPNTSSQIMVIFGRPLLATIDAIIKIDSGIMTLVFGNITLNVKIFLNPQHDKYDAEEETNYIEKVVTDYFDSMIYKDLVEIVKSNFSYEIGYTP